MPLGRPKWRHSSTNCMLRSKTCTRLFERSATNRRPCESNASACGPMNSPGRRAHLAVLARRTCRPSCSRTRRSPSCCASVGRGQCPSATMMSPLGAIAHAVGPMNVSRAGLRDAGLAERQQHLAVGAELEQLEPAPLGRGIVLRTDRCRPPRSCRRGPDRIRAPARTCRCRTGDRRRPTRRCAESAAPIGGAATCRPCRPGMMPIAAPGLMSPSRGQFGVIGTGWPSCWSTAG